MAIKFYKPPPEVKSFQMEMVIGPKVVQVTKTVVEKTGPVTIGLNEKHEPVIAETGQPIMNCKSLNLQHHANKMVTMTLEVLEPKVILSTLFDLEQDHKPGLWEAKVDKMFDEIAAVGKAKAAEKALLTTNGPVPLGFYKGGTVTGKFGLVGKKGPEAVLPKTSDKVLGMNVVVDPAAKPDELSLVSMPAHKVFKLAKDKELGKSSEGDPFDEILKKDPDWND